MRIHHRRGIWFSMLSIFLFGLLVAAPADAHKVKRGALTADFKIWLVELKKEARRKGISKKTLTAAFAKVAPIPRVIELDRRQPEFTMTISQYLDAVTPVSRIERGRQKLAVNRKLLGEVAAKYGVQARFIVALWGIETDFGRVTGGFPVIASLATLAHDGRRGKYFRSELMNALKILEEGHISAPKMMGSWAGAMGQPQFMPSSFVRYAIDHNGDGRRDIWGTRADVFASAANYLKHSGWRDDQTWGRRVKLPKGFNRNLAGNKIRKPMDFWRQAGLTSYDGSALPKRNLRASVIMPKKNGRLAYLVYGNYQAVLRWNRSDFFALAVGLLSDGIARLDNHGRGSAKK